MAGVKLKGFQSYSSGLKNTYSKATRAAQRRLETGSEAIARRAKRYAPVQHGNLEEAIETRKVRGEGGRNEFEVFVNINKAVGYDEHSDSEKTIGDYINFIHESDYELGEKSAEKDRRIGGSGYGYGRGGKVGRKFLARAFKDELPEIRESVREAVRRGLK